MNQLNGIPESMLIPLAARAIETDRSNPIIKDTFSKAIFQSLDYPFENITKSKSTQVGISIRTHLLDQLVRTFIEHNNAPLIINIGCGLDTRYERLNLQQIPWIDIDVPETMNVRKQFFTENTYRKMIAKSMLDYSWIDTVKSFPIYNKDKDILIIFEGVLMYFDKHTIHQLLTTITTSLQSHHITVAAEFCSKMIADHTQQHKAVSQLATKPIFKYGYNTLNALNDITPPHMRVVSELNYFDYFHKRWGVFGLCRWIPYLRNRLNNKIAIMSYHNK